MGAIAHRTILACRETLLAGFSERITGGEWQEGDSMGLPIPPRASVRSFIGHPHQVETLDAAPMAALHRDALDLAWRDGAWDIRVLRHPPLHGAELGCVTANRMANDPTLLPALVAAAERGTLVTWDWRPMRAGPALRRKAHAAKDASLRADGGRDGSAPEIADRIDWSRGGGIDVTIRLGTWSEAHKPKPVIPRVARATGAQRAYIVTLRRRYRIVGEPLPASLTRREASAIIDALLDRPAP